MSISHIKKTLEDFPLPPLKSLFSGGLTCHDPFVPDNVLAWKTSSDKTLSDISIHQRMILKIILSGNIITIVDGLRIPMSAGDMILFFPFQFHSTQLLCSPQDYSFLAISFTERHRDYSPLLPLKYHLLQPDNEDEKNIAALIRSLQPAAAPSEQGILALMELLLAQRRKILATPESATPNNMLDTETFDRICNYIRSHFNEEISLKTVAATFKLSEETVRRMFHKCLGNMTPAALIRRLRMQFAIELLERTDESIGTVAKQCGYLDTFVFSKAFKRHFGISPIHYRKSSQPPPNA